MLNIDPYTVLRENHKLKNTVTGLNGVVQEQADIIIKLKLRVADLDSTLKRRKEEHRCLRGERMRLCKQLFHLQVALLGLDRQSASNENDIDAILAEKGYQLQKLVLSTAGTDAEAAEQDPITRIGVGNLKNRVAKVAFGAERLLREINGLALIKREPEFEAPPQIFGRREELMKVCKEKLSLLLNGGQPCDVQVSSLLAAMLDTNAVAPEKLAGKESRKVVAAPEFSAASGLLFHAKPRRQRRLKNSKNSAKRTAEDDLIDLIWEPEELVRRAKKYHVEYTSLLTVRASYKDADMQTEAKPIEHRAVGDDAEDANSAESEEEARRDESIANLEAMGHNLFGGIDVQQVLDGHEEEDADTCFGKSDTKVFSTTTSTASDEQIDQFTKICMSLRTDRQSMDSRLQELHTKIHQRRKAAVESLKELETCLLKLEDFALDRTNEAAAAGELSAKEAETEKNKLRHLTQNAHTALHAMRQSMHRYSGQLELYGSMQQESKVSAAVDIMLVYLKMLKDEHDKKDRELQRIKKDFQESIAGTIIRRRMNKVRPIEITVDGNVVNLDSQLKLHSLTEPVAESSHYLDGPNLELRDVQLECDIRTHRDYVDQVFEVVTNKFPKLEAYLTVDETAIDHILDEEERLTQLRKLTRNRKVRVMQVFMLGIASFVVLVAVLLI